VIDTEKAGPRRPFPFHAFGMVGGARLAARVLTGSKRSRMVAHTLREPVILEPIAEVLRALRRWNGWDSDEQGRWGGQKANYVQPETMLHTVFCREPAGELVRRELWQSIEHTIGLTREVARAR
jgi:hypothetical protein